MKIRKLTQASHVLFGLGAMSLTSSAPALADEGDPPAQVLCLESLDVRQTYPIVSEVAPRARVHADEQTNCFVIVAHAQRYRQIQRVVEELEARAQQRGRVQRAHVR